MSAVFDFNASLNDVAPVPSISLAVEKMEEWVADECSSCAISFVFTTQIQLGECCVYFQCIT